MTLLQQVLHIYIFEMYKTFRNLYLIHLPFIWRKTKHLEMNIVAIFGKFGITAPSLITNINTRTFSLIRSEVSKTSEKRLRFQ